MAVADTLEELLDKIEATVDLARETDENLCAVDSYQVTAGEPAQPSGSCSAVSVWSSEFFSAATSLFQEDNSCIIVRGVHLNWRLDVCYSVGEKPPTSAEQLATARCFYGLAEAIWCGLNRLIGAGLLFDGMTCSDLAVDQLLVGNRSGGMVSASSGIRLQLDCPPEEAPS